MKHYPEQIQETQGFITGLQAGIQTLQQHPADGFADMEIQGNTYTDKSEAGTELIDACQEISSTDPVIIGSHRGFTLSVQFSVFSHKLSMKGAVFYTIDLGEDACGNITCIDNALNKMAKSLDNYKTKLSNLLQQQEAAEAAAVPMLSNTNMIMDKEDALWTANLLI